MVTEGRPYWLPEPWTQLSLPRVFDGDDDAGGMGGWSFAIVRVERGGRVTLPVAAREAIGGLVSLRLSSRGEVALLRCGRVGRPVDIDARGRLVVPCWLRDAADPQGSLLVGAAAERAGGPVVLFAPLRLLSGFADAMAGEG